MISLEQYNEYKKASAELVEAVKDKLEEICSDFDESDYIEESFRFNLDGIDYSVAVLEEDPWEDVGKYQYSGTTYQLVSYDKSVKNYVCNASIVDYFDVAIYHPVSRTGSYYSDYYYSYGLPTVSRIVTKHVPEVVIPAHDEIVFEEIQ